MLLLAVLEKTKEKGHKPDKYIKNKKKILSQKTKPRKKCATENKTTKMSCHRKQKNVMPQKTKNIKSNNSNNSKTPF